MPTEVFNAQSFKKITFIIESLGGGGAQHVATSLANKWIEDGYDISVVTVQDEKSDIYSLDTRITRIVIGGEAVSYNLAQAILQNIRRVLALRNVIKQGNSDIVISFVSTTNILTVLACIGLALKVVISERNDPSRQNIGSVWEKLRRLTYGHANIVTANSKAALKTMESYVSSNKLVWLPNPIKSPKKIESVDLPAQTILSVGRLHPQKAFDVLLEGFAAFSTRYPDWHLVILGEGPLMSDLVTQRARLQLDDKVSLPGFSDPFPYYDRSKIFILPSHFEGLPNVVLEAMSRGLSVIVTDQQTGLQGIVEDKKTGLVIKANAADEIDAALTRLVDDVDLRQKLGEFGRSNVSKFEENKVIGMWLNLIESLD